MKYLEESEGHFIFAFQSQVSAIAFAATEVQFGRIVYGQSPSLSMCLIQPVSPGCLLHFLQGLGLFFSVLERFWSDHRHSL